jgi:hypothetical protein
MFFGTNEISAVKKTQSKSKFLYAWIPYVLAVLIAYFLTTFKSLIDSYLSITHSFIAFMGSFIPMLKGLETAVNYSLFVGLSHSVFWLFIPIITACGWKVVAMSGDVSQMSFLKKSKHMRFFVYIFSVLFAVTAFSLPLPVEHRSRNEPYVFDTFFGLFLDFSVQAFCFFMLGMSIKYFCIDFKLFKGN